MLYSDNFHHTLSQTAISNDAQVHKYLCSHSGGGPLAGGANKGRPNWSKLNGGRSTKFGGGLLSGGGGPSGLPKAVKVKPESKLSYYYGLPQTAVVSALYQSKQQLYEYLKYALKLTHKTQKLYFTCTIYLHTPAMLCLYNAMFAYRKYLIKLQLW